MALLDTVNEIDELKKQIEELTKENTILKKKIENLEEDNQTLKNTRKV